MKKMLLRVINVNAWKQEEKSLVVAMLLMGVLNLSIVIVMLNR